VLKSNLLAFLAPWRFKYFVAFVAVLSSSIPALAQPGAPIGFDAARHLLNRTSFAASPAEIDAFSRLDREQAADRLLASTERQAATPPPAWATAPFESLRRFRNMSPEERKLARQEIFRQSFELQSWWLAEMLTTPSPLTERMALFWHNHFVSNLQKVRSPQLMYRQNVLLRRHALGNFGELLRAVSRDPAMVIYLDSAFNRKGKPNENFARELMELFTLGEGQYGEEDVKEAARAFTGWGIDPDSGEFRYRRGAHDDGAKTVLGRSGKLDGDAVIGILLAHPRTADFIVGKLWREFVSPAPDAGDVARMGRVFRDSGYDIRVAMRAVLTSDAFYDPRNRAVLIKSPVELVVGTLRQFHFRTGEVIPFVFASNQLGQRLFAPPNVKGWPGGEAWINSTTLLGRKAFLERLFRADELRPMLAATMDGTAGDMSAPKGAGRLPEGRERFIRAMMAVEFDSRRWLGQFGADDAAHLQPVLLAMAPVNAPGPDARGMTLIRELVQDPVYQLK
jgi:uncharacterized protein (DUF1800 family)